MPYADTRKITNNSVSLREERLWISRWWKSKSIVEAPFMFNVSILVLTSQDGGFSLHSQGLTLTTPSLGRTENTKITWSLDVSDGHRSKYFPPSTSLKIGDQTIITGVTRRDVEVGTDASRDIFRTNFQQPSENFLIIFQVKRLWGVCSRVLIYFWLLIFVSWREDLLLKFLQQLCIILVLKINDHR